MRTKPTSEMLTFFRRDLVHGVWQILLDDEVKEASRIGILIECSDKIVRRVFPRILSVSADYKERCVLPFLIRRVKLILAARVTLASIQFLGQQPCPLCYVDKEHVHRIGKKSLRKMIANYPRVDLPQRQNEVESARRNIYVNGCGINSLNVRLFLSTRSMVPCRVCIAAKCTTEP